MSTNTKPINIQISGDQDAVDTALVFDRPEVYRPSPCTQLHQRSDLEQPDSSTRRTIDRPNCRSIDQCVDQLAITYSIGLNHPQRFQTDRWDWI